MRTVLLVVIVFVVLPFLAATVTLRVSTLAQTQACEAKGGAFIARIGLCIKRDAIIDIEEKK